MSLLNLTPVAHAVVSRAQEHGYVVPHDVRTELAQAGLPEEHWKDVIDLARPALTYRHGRYYYLPPAVARLRARSREDQSSHQVLRKAIRQVIQQYRRVAVETERREHDRIQFLQPIQVVTADGREISLLSRDVSLSGLRVLGTHDLLGQKVKVLIPRTDKGARQWCFLVHILWTNLVADGLYESGGIFVEVVPEGETLRLVVAEE
jgi:hypothetical protein